MVRKVMISKIWLMCCHMTGPFRQGTKLVVILVGLVLVSDTASLHAIMVQSPIPRAPIANQLPPAQAALINQHPAENPGSGGAGSSVPAHDPINPETLHGSVAIAMARNSGALAGVTVEKVPVYRSSDFLTGYLTNLTDPIIVDGKPWDYGSTNMVQYKASQGGGTTYWDYWSEDEDWASINHQWRDDQGNWHTYSKETIEDPSGKRVTAYVLLDRQGPGVMDKLWFTQDPTQAFLSLLWKVNLFWSADAPDVVEWGSLSKLGNLRIEVDDAIVYDGPIESWFAGDAQLLPEPLKQILVWHYRQFGSDGNIIPIAYQEHLKVSVYGGKGKPKWFMATGISLPPGTHVKPYSTDDLPIDQMAAQAENVQRPETFVDSLPNPQSFEFKVQAGYPSTVSFQGAGTIAAMQIKLGKQYDPRELTLRVRYGTTVGIDLPLLAFFSEPDHLSFHHSTPIGVLDTRDAYLFYSNLPMPYQNDISIEVSTQSPNPIPLTVKLAQLETTFGTQLRTQYNPPKRLETNGPDYGLHVDGDGKMVGLVLITGDQQYDQIPKPKTTESDSEEIDQRVWPMGYLEGNLTISDGAGSLRMYSGQEDWAEGGYYFNAGYTTPTGGSNRPFGGILRYKGGPDGYATLFRYFNDLSAFRFKNGLNLTFGHGTYRNNFPVAYSTVVYYYLQMPGAPTVTLPASDLQVVTSSKTPEETAGAP